MTDGATDDYESLSQEVEDRALEAAKAEAPAAPARNTRLLLLIALLIVWVGAAVYAIPRLPADAPPATNEDRVLGALDELEAAANFVDACLQAETGQLPAALPSEQFPGVTFQANGAKAYELSMEVGGERIGLNVAEDGERTFSGKGTDPYEPRGEQ